MDKERIEQMGGRMVETLDPHQIDEAKMWTEFIRVLANGIVKPYDPAFIADKLTKIENKHRVDLTELKNCCPQESTIREALPFKPYIDAALSRIETITGITVSKEIWK